MPGGAMGNPPYCLLYLCEMLIGCGTQNLLRYDIGLLFSFIFEALSSFQPTPVILGILCILLFVELCASISIWLEIYKLMCDGLGGLDITFQYVCMFKMDVAPFYLYLYWKRGSLWLLKAELVYWSFFWMN